MDISSAAETLIDTGTGHADDDADNDADDDDDEGHVGCKLGILEPCWLQVGGSSGHLGLKLRVFVAILAPSWGS